MEDRIICNKRINELIMRDHFLRAPYAKIRFEESSTNLSIYIAANEYETVKKFRNESNRGTLEVDEWIQAS